jgi:hypothetical protein
MSHTRRRYGDAKGFAMESSKKRDDQVSVRLPQHCASFAAVATLLALVTNPSVLSVMTLGITSGRGKGRDQSRRGTFVTPALPLGQRYEENDVGGISERSTFGDFLTFFAIFLTAFFSALARIFASFFGLTINPSASIPVTLSLAIR